MKTKVTLQERLKDLRVERNLNQEDVADAIGISKSALSTYESDETMGIPHFNLVKLAEFYGVSLDYLFDKSPIREDLNIEISALGLDKETIEILKEQKLNNRLMCELVKHPEFKNLLADIEIYVDGVAGLFFQSVSTCINGYREDILHDMPKEKDDIINRVFELSKYEEDSYFSNRIHSTFKPIIDDVREAHKKDFETATDTSIKHIISESVKNLPDPSEDDFAIKTLFHFFCAEAGLPESTVTEQEYAVFTSWMRKSKKYKSLLKQRKNARKTKRATSKK